jgi:hypothetical protein
MARCAELQAPEHGNSTGAKGVPCEAALAIASAAVLPVGPPRAHASTSVSAVVLMMPSLTELAHACAVTTEATSCVTRKPASCCTPPAADVLSAVVSRLLVAASGAWALESRAMQELRVAHEVLGQVAGVVCTPGRSASAMLSDSAACSQRVSSR